MYRQRIVFQQELSLALTLEVVVTMELQARPVGEAVVAVVLPMEDTVVVAVVTQVLPDHREAVVAAALLLLLLLAVP